MSTLIFRFSSNTKPDMQRTIDPILTALDRCGIAYDPKYTLEQVNRGVVDRVNWELSIRIIAVVSEDLLDCIRDRLPPRVDVEVAN